MALGCARADRQATYRSHLPQATCRKATCHGATCHGAGRAGRQPPGGTGASVLRQSDPVKTFESLFAELADRAVTRPEGSGTVDALDAGVHAQGKKLLEEAGEVWIAAEHEDDDSLAMEISQLIYRAQVIMIGRGISLEQVYQHL